MTTEKRRQMQKLKEKALNIEQRIRERKQRADDGNVLNNEDVISQTSRSSLINTCASNTQRSQESYDGRIKETEESMILLQNLIKRQQTGSVDKPIDIENTACNISIHMPKAESQEKMQKLQKSEILIYDNSTNEVIQVPPIEKVNLREVDTKLNLTYEGPKKPAHLLLAGVNSKGMTSIPAICLNPPTPLTVNKNICDKLSADITSELSSADKKTNDSLDLADELSSDESFNSMVTQTDRRSVRSVSKNNTTKYPRSGSVERTSLIPVTPVKNVSAKIQQFEAISSDSNTPQSSPEKLYKSRKSCLGLTLATMSRSATSPSLKLNTSNRSSTSAVQNLGQNSDTSPENNLVRSSSFTLEGPSKVLIDHMQQQKQQQHSEQKPITEAKSSAKSPLNTTRSVARKPISSPLRAHRDTVESKAKKVQKVELKSSKLKIQQKASQSKLALAAAATITPYNSNSLTQHSNNLCKTKRSPYDLTKTSQTSLQKTSSTQMRKSNSTSSNLSQTKTSKSRPSSANIQTPTSVSSNTARTPQNDQDSLNHMEKSQKEKFLHLLAQQQEEHRRLQQSFEIQQKMLLEQLNREMAATHIKSSNNSNSSGSYKKPEQRPLSPRLQNQLNLTGLLTDSGSQKPSTPTSHNTYSPPSLSNNSSYLSMTKNSSQTCNYQYSSYGSQYNHNSSQITLMDQSNANTSLDISTLSTQTSPETQYITPTPKQIYNMDNTTLANKSTSSSRRRLFTTEINGVESGDNNFTKRSSNGAISCHQTLQLQRPNSVIKSPKTLVNNGNNSRRVSVKFY